MGNPQGSQVFDTTYIDNATKQLDSIDVCKDLQDFMNKEMKDIQDQVNGLESQMKWVKPLMELLTAPEADLQKIVTWISDFITAYMKPMVAPYITYAQQIQKCVEAVAKLTAAAENAAQRIGSCVLSLPALAVPDVSGAATSTTSGGSTTS